MQWLAVSAVVLAASLVAGAAGFGAALVAMPLLLPMLGARTAPPLMALLAASMLAVLIARYRRDVSFREIWRLMLASLPAVPAGTWLARNVDERLVFGFLAAVLVGYALYALRGLKTPELGRGGWAYAAGAAAGLLGGAYNTDGPPVIIYGSCRRWSPREFKGNLQVFFSANSAVILAAHAAAGNFTPQVWRLYAAALPAMAAGLAAGLAADRWINAERFRRMTLWLLVALGLRLGCRAALGV